MMDMDALGLGKLEASFFCAGSVRKEGSNKREMAVCFMGTSQKEK